VLVLPSLDEGFGLTALEAMSAGVPVVASNRGSLPEVIGDGGLLVEPDDIDALSSAIERIVTRPEEATRSARAGLERARAFTWETSAAMLRTAYVDAIARRRERGR
jgi:glycosyltransferase involved in cell wall biosynthesis